MTQKKSQQKARPKLSKSKGRPPGARGGAKSSKEVEYAKNTWSECIEASETDIASVEQSIGARFPPELRQLLLTCNAGRPRNNFLESNGFEQTVGRLIPISKIEGRRLRGIADVISTLTSNEKWPKKLLPFAYDEGNANIYAVDPTGKVIYWLHDEDISESRRVVARNVAEFLERLSPRPY